MLSSPVWRGTPALALCLGLVAGGTATATVLLVAGSLVRAPLPQPARWAVVAAGLGVALLHESGVLRFRLPQNRRLVPETVLRLGRHLGPLAFGIEMGTGARTYLPSALPYGAGVAVLMLAPVPAALCAGAGFGLGRALMAVASLRYGPDGGWGEQWLRRSHVVAPAIGLAFAASLVAVVVATAR